MVPSGVGQKINNFLSPSPTDPTVYDIKSGKDRPSIFLDERKTMNNGRRSMTKGQLINPCDLEK